MITETRAPELFVSEWLNTPAPLSLEALKGKVVLIEAFQMLCPGCVSHALPQAMKVRDVFPEDQIAVLGLHSVFEHHEAQGHRAALEAFLHEYRISFPVGIDEQSETAPLPKTMMTYGMRGTPTTLLIDRNGILRRHSFGLIEDMVLGAEIATLLTETPLAQQDAIETDKQVSCSDGACPAPSPQ
ncbi:MAG: TlpA disulfide reductase family protein [Pseudomonadota bacterium]